MSLRTYRHAGKGIRDRGKNVRGPEDGYCGCSCIPTCTWCTGLICTTGSNRPVKLDCRDNCTVSLSFGLTASFGDLDIAHFAYDESACLSDIGGTLDDPDVSASVSFAPKQRVLISEPYDEVGCLWSYGYSNSDSKFYRDRECDDNEFGALDAEIIVANRDRWLYRQEAHVAITGITATGAPDPPEGVDPEDPQTAIDWRIIFAWALIDGTYTHRHTVSNLDCIWHFPTASTTTMGIYFYGAKWVRVSEICAGNTVEITNDLDSIPDVAPYNTYEPIAGSTGTMSVLFNPDVPDNAHLATDLSPAYELTFLICPNEGDSFTRSITVYQGAYPDSRTWESETPGEASLNLYRFGESVSVAEYAPGDGDETLFILDADFEEIDLPEGEFIVPLDRYVELYVDESNEWTVYVKATASEASNPNDPPCPSE